MSILRFKALETIQSRKFKSVDFQKENIAETFGMYVFGHKQMKKYLSREIYKSLAQSIDSGERISRKVADEVAASMKAWALEQGATHYTH
nr:glutamine synthetase III [Bacteroidota bacterium]